MSIVMGTAGHIDHGKTTLIKALTGIDCDRLKEEKKRGITIELGFAYMDLPDGGRLSIVDVPGHEKFVKNMVAGASGIDFVLLTVAADEGIMPQTKEHIEICSLLGINAGIVALTKVDLVDEELLELAIEDVKDYLSNTFLKDAEIVCVSAHTGQGLEELKSTIIKMVEKVQKKESSDIFILPVDRVFTLKGHGTVITGTLVSGDIKVGEDVTLYPKEKPSKVRHIQVHGESAQYVKAGRRTAINLANLEVDDIERGDVVARPNTLFPSTTWDVVIECLSSSPRPLLHRKEVHFHHGTKEIMARVYLLDKDRLEPGDKGFAQIRFSEPMVGVFGDRFVIRSFSPLRTIAGGILINPLGKKIKRFSQEVTILEKLLKARLEEKILLHLNQMGTYGCSFKMMHVLTNVNSKDLKRAIDKLLSSQQIFCFDKEEKIYVSSVVVEDILTKLLSYIENFHQKNPMELGLPKGQLFSDWGKKLPKKLVNFLIEHGIKKGLIEAEEDIIRKKGHKISLGKDETKLKELVLKEFIIGGYTPPSTKKIMENLKVNKREIEPILKLLQEEKKIIKVKEDLYFSKETIEDIKSKVIKFFETNQEMKPQDFKALTNLSRKFSIPLLEYLDKEKITIRVGDVRKLRRK